MLEKPGIADDALVSALRDHYRVAAAEVAFLPLGADRDTAVYRVTAVDSALYFLKVRLGAFQEITATLPRYLADQGIRPVIAPLTARSGRLWARADPFTMILYPYVEGQDGYETPLSPEGWRCLGEGLKSLHTLSVPAPLAGQIPRDTYSAQWRQALRAILFGQVDAAPGDPVSAELRAFLEDKREAILDLVGRAERLAERLATRSPEFVLCHPDVHAGNVLIDSAGAIYIVDWDNPIFAPKERDLMYPGAGLFGNGRAPEEEERLFYQGYGQTEIDPAALAYCRYERIVEDMAILCEEILGPNMGQIDREQSLRYLKANFLPGGTIAIAYEADEPPAASEPDQPVGCPRT